MTTESPNGSRPSRARPTTRLQLRGVTAGYGRTTVLRDVDLLVPTGSVAALLGPNGAGKTTLLRVASGLLAARRRAGDGRRRGLTDEPAVPAGPRRALPCARGPRDLPDLTVRENLLLQVPPWDSGPRASSRRSTRSRCSASGSARSRGTPVRRPAADARAVPRFLADPRVVLLDEVSMGLAPRIIDEIFQALVQLSRAGVALLLVEQYVSRALKSPTTSTCSAAEASASPARRASSTRPSSRASTSAAEPTRASTWGAIASVPGDRSYPRRAAPSSATAGFCF